MPRGISLGGMNWSFFQRAWFLFAWTYAGLTVALPVSAAPGFPAGERLLAVREAFYRSAQADGGQALSAVHIPGVWDGAHGRLLGRRFVSPDFRK